MKQTLKVLTFNAWMLRTPFGVDIARHVDERAKRIPKAVAATGADIVALQEVWDPGLRAQLEEGLRKEGYAYSASQAETSQGHEALAVTSMAAALGPLLAAHTHRDPAQSRRQFLKQCALFAGGIGLNAWGAGSMALGSFRRTMGNGLMIVSRFPIEPEIGQLRFSRHTRTDETLVLKGAIVARVRHPRLGLIDVFNSHLGAVSYEPDHERYSPTESADRLHQTGELVKWMAEQRRSDIAFLAVDLNVDYRDFAGGKYLERPSAEYSLITRELGWRDTYRVVHAPGGAAEITDDSANPYKASGHFKNSPDCVIDYVFASPSARMKVVDSNVVLKQPLSQEAAPALRLSDHYGVLSHFSFG